MTKFEVYKESHIEARKGVTLWTATDMLEYHNNRTSTYLELVASFDTKEEAGKFFEEEKKNCSSYYQDGYNGKLVLFDLIELQENEYDEDGDLIQTLDIWDIYVAEIE